MKETLSLGKEELGIDLWKMNYMVPDHKFKMQREVEKTKERKVYQG